MKKNLQLFISYCGADKLEKDGLNAHLIPLQEDYAKIGVDLEICEMETHCVGEWDKWMIGAIKESDVVICILNDSLFTGEKAGKRLLEELRTARDENKGVVPLILTDRELPDEYKAHIGRLSQVWYTYENGNVEEAYQQAADKAKLLLDGVLRGEKIDQGDSVRILSGAVSKNEKFVGRQKEMEWLRQKLTETNVVILKGEGGIGKTSLAENFFYQNTDLFSHAYIVTATNGVRKGICSVPFENTRHIKEEDERYRENYRLLSALSEKTIIILDNCDEDVNAEELAQLIDQMKCRFMVTSRVGNDDFTDYTLDVGKMQDEDLLALTYKHYPSIVKDNGGDKKGVEKRLCDFFHSVGGHTLAVEMASAIMRDGDIPVEKIHEAILKCNEKCKTRHGKEKKATPSDHLAVLYDFANVSQIQEDILSAVCLIEPAVGILRKDLKELLELEDNNDINELVAKTFLRMEERVVSMHPLFSDVFYQVKKVAEKKEQNAEIIEYLLRIKVNEYDLEGNEQKALLLGFLIKKRQDAFKEDDEGQEWLACVYHSCAGCLEKIVQYGKAIEYYLKAIEIEEKVYGKDANASLAASYNNIGSTYNDLGEHEKALEYYLKALRICEIVYVDNPNHPDLAMSYNNIGHTYGRLGETEKALEYHLKALQIREVVYAESPNHPDLARSYNNIGGAYGQLGEHEKALEYYLKALRIRETIYAGYPNHPALAGSYNNIGCEYNELGEFERALEYHLKALRIREIIYAEYPNHPDLALSYNNIGYSYDELGEHEKALEYYLKALQIYETIYADYPNHPDLALSYNNIGSVYGELGEYEKALEYYLKALQIYETIYAEYPNHPALARSYNNIGYSYDELGEYEKALEYHLKALQIRETIYAEYPNHPDLAMSYNNIGFAYGGLGEHEKALEYCLKSLQIYETVYAGYPNHPDLANGYFNVAYTYEKLEDYERALFYYEKAKQAFTDEEDVALAEEKIALMKEKLGIQ